MARPHSLKLDMDRAWINRFSVFLLFSVELYLWMKPLSQTSLFPDTKLFLLLEDVRYLGRSVRTLMGIIYCSMDLIIIKGKHKTKMV